MISAQFFVCDNFLSYFFFILFCFGGRKIPKNHQKIIRSQKKTLHCSLYGARFSIKATFDEFNDQRRNLLGNINLHKSKIFSRATKGEEIRKFHYHNSSHKYSFNTFFMKNLPFINSFYGDGEKRKT